MEVPLASVISKHDFLLLSASINYQLMGDPVNWRAVMALLVGNVEVDHEQMLIQLLEYLHCVYAGSKRRLGPMSVLHPIRNAGLLCRALDEVIVPDLVTAMLHDKLEDIVIHPHDLANGVRLEASYQQLVGDLDPEWQIPRRILLLTRQPGDTYYAYLGRLLDETHDLPELVRIKLADRLDNTLDMGIDIESELSGIDSFELIFDILYTSSRVEAMRRFRHPIPRKMNGAQRLYQLFKNVVFLSLLRLRGADQTDVAAERLFESLASASLEETKSILVHLFIYHLPDVHRQRTILLEAMQYCHRGAIQRVTHPGTLNPLDGLFAQHFDHRKKSVRQQKLAEMYRDKHLMALATLAFASIFSNFLNDRTFYVRGIDESGIHLPEA